MQHDRRRSCRALPRRTHPYRRPARRSTYQATVRLHTPADSEAARASATYGRIEPVDSRTCLLHIGADDARAVTFLMGALTVDFEVVDAPDLSRELRAAAARFNAAAGADQ
ncbi:hypothetical protein [Nocardia sp.]|uniref:hypothetical protein n=1 Tax=Nocardia sp. TaxID=1821 RepID=UPI003F8E2CE9